MKLSAREDVIWRFNQEQIHANSQKFMSFTFTFAHSEFVVCCVVCNVNDAITVEVHVPLGAFIVSI